MSELIVTNNLVKRFGAIVAASGISLKVKRGEVLGFLGPNGAGKSTTMRMITGFLMPTEGEAIVCGHNVVENPVEAKKKIGYLAEGAPVYGDMLVADFLTFIAEMRGLKGSDAASAVNRVLDMTGLDIMRDRAVENLSKGYKRRVGIAQALIHDPEVLILDEPTDGLDPNQKHEVRKLIKEMAAKKAIIISTHILEEVEAVCTRAVVIANGKIVADGTPQELEARSNYHNSVHLTVLKKDADDIHKALLKVVGVFEIERHKIDETHEKLIALTRNQVSVIADMSMLIQKQGFNVIELRQERGRLDDVFRDLTAA